jgi:signal transduction histidine kinase
MKGTRIPLWLGCFSLFVLGRMARAAEPQLPLTTASEVGSISPEEARAHRPVRLDGVVTFSWHQGTSEFTVQDETGAVWVSPISLPPQFVVGSRIALEGRTEAGAIGTILLAENIRVLGASTLPRPRAASYEELFSDALHGTRVEVSGVVRGQRVNPEAGLGWLALELATGGKRLTVNVTHEISGHPELIDARVRIRGVNLRALGRNQTGFLPILNAHSLEDLSILDAPAPQPFQLPTVPLGRVMRDPSSGGSGRRIRVQGVVSALRSHQAFFLQDTTRGLEVLLRDGPQPAVGDSVQVVGFPEAGTFSPTLRDADWRPDAPTSALEPLATDFHGALRHDGRLLALDGRVKTWNRLSQGIAWTLETPKGSFRIVVPGALPSLLPEGSVVKATGVCSVEASDWESLVVRQQPTGFTLLARRPEDVIVLRRAPFWTGRNVAIGLALLGTAAGALQGILWIRARRRIRELSRNRDEAQSLFRAILAERTRMAREIHDTLAQGFTAISAQLEVLHQSAGQLTEPLRKHLELARELVRSSLEESRRSVWNLRSQSLEEHGFAKTLERLGTQLVAGAQTAFHFTQSGAVRELSPAIENNVLRIGQEALTNAVRHGCPHRITCSLAFEADTLRLEISDDGAGFAPGPTQGSMQGGFGISGMQERAREIHGKLVVESQPGAGTRITLTLPLSHV